MSDLITELHALAKRMSAAGETDEPTTVALATEEIERLRGEVERLHAEIAERDQLKAHLARLSLACSDNIVDWVYCGMATNGRHKEQWAVDQYRELRAALSATPAQSLAAHDAAVIERIRDKWSVIFESENEVHTQDEIIDALTHEINQLHQQAQGVQL